jgi:hypothetical protein
MSVVEKLNQSRELERELAERARSRLAPPSQGLASLSEGSESAASSHAQLHEFASTTMLPPVDDATESDRAATAPAGSSAASLDTPRSPGSSRPPRPPRPPLDAPKSPRVIRRPEHAATEPATSPFDVILASPRVRKMKYASLLADPSMVGVGSRGPVRARKEGSPLRLVSRATSSDDAILAISPLAAGLASSVRAQLLRAIEERAETMARDQAAKMIAKANEPSPKHTDMIRYTTAALHVTHKRPSTADSGEPSLDPDADQPEGSVLGEHMAANVPKLNIVY